MPQPLNTFPFASLNVYMPGHPVKVGQSNTPESTIELTHSGRVTISAFATSAPVSARVATTAAVNLRADFIACPDGVVLEITEGVEVIP